MNECARCGGPLPEQPWFDHDLGKLVTTVFCSTECRAQHQFIEFERAIGYTIEEGPDYVTVEWPNPN